jgi:RNA polymerase sigma-70 factor (ECF subfamily)
MIHDPAAWFKEEVHVHNGQLKSYLMRTFPSLRDTEDVVQESYLKIWRFRALKPIRSSKSFLFQTARNVALNLIRKRRNSPFEDGMEFAASQVLDPRPNAADALLSQECLDCVAEALASLPPRCREVIVRHKFKGAPQKEVAGALGLSERTVANYTLSGISRMSAFLKSRGMEFFQ